MSQDTQEKRHPPTASKLKRARREGRVAHARDVVALTTWPTLVWLYFNWNSFEASLHRLIAGVATSDLDMPSDVAVRRLTMGVLSDAYAIIVPILLIAALMAVVISIIDTGGVIFSGKPIAPDFNRLNPAQGFKRIFSIRTAAESIYGLLKLAVLALATTLILLAALDTLRRTQACGLACLPHAISATIEPILAVFLALFLLAAIGDFLLGRALFRHEMRMSDTELKRENKDVYGNPDFKRHRRGQGQQMAEGPARLGLRAATFLVVGQDHVIGLRYVAAEAPAPFVVLKAAGPGRSELLTEARKLGIPIRGNRRLAALLAHRGVTGSVIPPQSFADVAREIIDMESA